jgi:orotate phosphoribosyltransferase
MTGDQAVVIPAAEADLSSILQLPDDVLQARLKEMIRESGVKFRSREAFAKSGWRDGPPPAFAKFWKTSDSGVVPSQDDLIWDLRDTLLRDEALAYCCALLYRRAQPYGVRWVGGMETAAIPIVSGLLAVNRACGGPPLNGFYIRKSRKRDGLRRLLEGPRPPRGERVLLVDDILNKGISKRPLIDYCADNELIPSALLVVVNTGRRGAELFDPVCPVESIFMRRDVLGTREATVDPPDSEDSEGDGNHGPQVDAPPPSAPPLPASARPAAARGGLATEMSRADIELVRLARDTVTFTALSAGELNPTIEEDGRGSPGYSPFLGRYLEEPGAVFTRISKREYRDGQWFNRMRGCQAVGLVDPAPGPVAEMTVKSAIVSATRARKVQAGPAIFHKAIWPGEIGALSLFVYVIEELVPTTARTAADLVAEGHEPRTWGLIAQGEGFRGVVCGDLDGVPDVATQVAVACRKMQNRAEIRPHDPDEVTLIRMRGRWLWDPARPKAEFF